MYAAFRDLRLAPLVDRVGGQVRLVLRDVLVFNSTHFLPRHNQGLAMPPFDVLGAFARKYSVAASN